MEVEVKVRVRKVFDVFFSFTQILQSSERQQMLKNSLLQKIKTILQSFLQLILMFGENMKEYCAG